MFNNIGSKIKTVAKIICWIGIVLSVISGLIFMISGAMYGAMYGAISILGGILVMLIGSISSWIGSFMTYGFGQLVENSDILVKQGYRRKSPEQNSDPA